MRKFLISILVNTLALLLIDYISPSINFTSTTAVIVLALVITVLNSTLNPALQLLSFPVSVVTLGLFRFVINGAVLLLAFNLTDGASINGLWPAILASIALSFLTSILEDLFGTGSGKKRKRNR
ncbi:MAG: phage holin family protein [Erysipelotrichaceae bacterium]|nr:phage holin family protein [Erysipelotrichaceae bacterium]